jgi:hypothetical protein
MGIAPGGGKRPFPTRDDANRTVRTGSGAAPTKGGEEAEKALRGAHQVCPGPSTRSVPFSQHP